MVNHDTSRQDSQRNTSFKEDAAAESANGGARERVRACACADAMPASRPPARLPSRPPARLPACPPARPHSFLLSMNEPIN